MADPTYDPEDLTFALFREYQTKPFYRRACVISYAPETMDKYRLTEVDMAVCDTGFMSKIARVMATPQPIRASQTDKSGKGIRMVILDKPTVVGSEQHFTLAVEVIPDAVNVEPSRMVI
jgi:hypothetical protein